MFEIQIPSLQRTMKKITICMVVSILSLFLTPLSLGAQTKGIKVVIKDTSGRKVGLYKSSYALLIGISIYTAGWPKLNAVPNEIKQVAALLKKRGFHVVKVMNPTGDALKDAFEDFINNYGFEQDSRLLFYFSGHGHTLHGGEKGYLVPTDAPNPNNDRIGFLRKALPMNQILAWSRQMEAKHALFLFDSCFSGTVFKAKNLPEKPPHISRATDLSVRQYIAAGDAGESVPAKSVFTPAFIDALDYGWGDLNGDGYISGTELGLYLQEKVPQHSTQNPQYGKIKDYELARGDFIFQLASSGATVSKQSPVQSRSILSVSANVSGASVLIDNRILGATPLDDTQVSPGHHSMRIEKEGYEPYRKLIRLERGRSMSLYVELNAVRPRKGRLFVDTEPSDARVRILNIGPVFFQGMELDSGRYHVEVSARHHQAEKMWIELSTGEDKNISIRLNPVITEQPSFSRRTKKKLINNLGMEFVFIPSGSFMMGSGISGSEVARHYGGEGEWYKDEHPKHRVTISKPFYMQSTEITVGQWQEFIKDSGYKTEAETGGGAWIFTDSDVKKEEGYYWKKPGFKQSDKNPVTCVSWNDVQVFVKWLNRKEGKIYRLPTEAEWEYACRAGTKSRFSWGNNTDCSKANYGNGFFDCADCKGQNSDHTMKVGSFSPNPWGLYDMHGNVQEWCHDWYGKYSPGSIIDPTGPSSGSHRVIRGGNWFSCARNCRSAQRRPVAPDSGWANGGFRLVMDSDISPNSATIEKTSQLSVSSEAARDGAYIGYSNGIVKDTKTGLEWKAGPNKNTNWNKARSWVKSLNLDGGGWRMPTMDELQGLYKKGMGSHNLTSLLLNTTYKYLYVWSGETEDSWLARFFGFAIGDRYEGDRIISDNVRAFAVRSREERNRPDQAQEPIKQTPTDSRPFSAIETQLLGEWRTRGDSFIIIFSENGSVKTVRDGITIDRTPNGATLKWRIDASKKPIHLDLFMRFPSGNEKVVPAIIEFISADKMWTKSSHGFKSRPTHFTYSESKYESLLFKQ